MITNLTKTGKVLGWIWLSGSVIYIGWFLIGIILMLSRETEGIMVASSVLGMLQALVALPSLILAIALLKGKTWGRIGLGVLSTIIFLWMVPVLLWLLLGFEAGILTGLAYTAIGLLIAGFFGFSAYYLLFNKKIRGIEA